MLEQFDLLLGPGRLNLPLGEAEALDLVDDSGQLYVFEYQLNFQIILIGLNRGWGTSSGRKSSWQWQ